MTIRTVTLTGILLAVALSLLRHVRHSYRPHTMVLAPDESGRWLPMSATPGLEYIPMVSDRRICRLWSA